MDIRPYSLASFFCRFFLPPQQSTMFDFMIFLSEHYQSDERNLLLRRLSNSKNFLSRTHKAKKDARCFDVKTTDIAIARPQHRRYD